MEGWYQWGVLVVGCDVVVVEVGDDIDVGQFCQQGGVVDLYCEVVSGFMLDGLIVIVDGMDFVGVYLLLEQQFVYVLCCKGDLVLFDFGGVGDFIGIGDVQGEDVFVQFGWYGQVMGSE